MTATMVAQPATITRLDGKLLAMADYLKQRAARDPRWGASFIRALDKAIAQHQQGHTAHRHAWGCWQAPSASQEFQTYHVSRWACSCEASKHGLWCWHQAQVLWFEVEAEFDNVHGLTEDDEEDADEELPYADHPSYRVIRELGD